MPANSPDRPNALLDAIFPLDDEPYFQAEPLSYLDRRHLTHHATGYIRVIPIHDGDSYFGYPATSVMLDHYDAIKTHFRERLKIPSDDMKSRFSAVPYSVEASQCPSVVRRIQARRLAPLSRLILTAPLILDDKMEFFDGVLPIMGEHLDTTDSTPRDMLRTFFNRFADSSANRAQYGLEVTRDAVSLALEMAGVRH